ncbi:MAG: alpha/beta fold hydrolase [Sandaracinus sp.]
MTSHDATGECEILVTGATGMIGRWLLAALTRRGHRVAALVRRAGERGPELAAFVERLGGDPRRLVVVEGDVERERLGLGVPLDSVRVVYHLAARFAFGLSRAEAHAANVEGTQHVVRWAARQPTLTRFVLLGGYRMTKVDLGALDARALDAHYAAGAYEGSKIEAYAVFRSLAAELGVPWTAVHPSGVIGDARTGETTQIVGLGETVQRLYERRLPALAGSERTFVPVVTVDFLADYLATVPARAESEGKDLVVFDPASPALPELVKKLGAILGVPAPAWTLPVGWVAALPSSLTGVHRESTRFLVEDGYDTREGDAHARAMGLRHPPLDEALSRWCSFLVSTRFLAAPASEIGRFARGTFVVGELETADTVLLHGIPFDGEAMAPLARALGGRTASIDLPGLGRSGDAGEHDAHLSALLARPARPRVLVGHSLGSALAVRHAAAHPADVAALVLVAPAFLASPGPWTLRLSPIVARVLGGLDAAGFDRRFLAEGDASLTRAARESALASLARAGAAARYARALADAIAKKDETLEAYARVRARGIPVLVVHAPHEAPVHDLRGATAVPVAGAGHNPHLTHTSEVARAIRSFLSLGAPARRPDTPPAARTA